MITKDNMIYTTTATGYTISLNGTPWIVQDGYIPYPGATMTESAQNHINQILADQAAADSAASQPTMEDRVSELQTIAGVNPIDTTTLDGAKQSKLREIATVCQSTIYAGVDVLDTKDTEHFSLTVEDQANLSALAMAIGTGLTSVLYHANGQLCREFTASEFTNIYTVAKNFVTYNTTLCNHLNVWIRRCTNIDDVSKITYTSALPDDLLANFNTILGINK